MKTMQCPACPPGGAALIVVERQGIEIDYCSTCRGVWLDRGELDKLIEHSATREADRDRSRDHDRNRDRDRDRDRGDYRDRDGKRERYRDDDDDDDRRTFGFGDDRESPEPRRRRREGILGELFDF